MPEYIGARNTEAATGIKGFLNRILKKLKGKPSAQEAYNRLSEAQRALIDGMEGNPGMDSNNGEYSLMVNGKGNRYVRADRVVIDENSNLSPAEQVEYYIVEAIANGVGVRIPMVEGDVITIDPRTAHKSVDRGYTSFGKRHRLNKNDFMAKLEAASHIDELISASTVQHHGAIRYNTKDRSGKPVKAKNGWNYRTAYFVSSAGNEYKIDISVANDGDVKLAYSIGKPGNKKITVGGNITKDVSTGSKAAPTVTDGMVPQSDASVNSYSMQNPDIDAQGDYSLMDTLLVDNTTKKAVSSIRPQTLSSFEPITASEMGSNSFSADRVPQTEPAVNSYSMQEPEIDAQGDYSLMDTDRRYTYDWLAKKPDMSVTVIDDESKYSATADGRKRLISDAIRNAKKIGKENSAGNAVIHVTDTDTDVTLSSRSLRHGLDRRFSVLAPVTENVGEILQNSVRINELVPSKDTVDSSYVLIGAAKNKNNDPYIVQFVVNRSSNEVTSVDVLYSVNAKKEPAALLPKFTGAPATLTGSTISISNLLDYVNKYYPDILPEDVLRHYGHESRPDGKLGESVLFSLMDTLPQEKPPQQETQQP